MKKLPTSFYACEQSLKLALPLMLSHIQAGFPSPAEDHVEQELDLNAFLIKHPAATFFVRVEGESMTGAGIKSGDLIIVDRAVQASNNAIVLAMLNGEFTIKRIRKIKNKLFLVPENPAYKEIEISTDMDFEIWGVITFVIHDARL